MAERIRLLMLKKYENRSPCNELVVMRISNSNFINQEEQ